MVDIRHFRNVINVVAVSVLMIIITFFLSDQKLSVQL